MDLAKGERQARQGPHGSNGQPKDNANAAAEVVWNADSALFVKMHKERLKKSLVFDSEPCRKAEVSIVKAIIMQFTILSHKSSIVKGFLQNISKKF